MLPRILQASARLNRAQVGTPHTVLTALQWQDYPFWVRHEASPGSKRVCLGLCLDSGTGWWPPYKAQLWPQLWEGSAHPHRPLPFLPQAGW